MEPTEKATATAITETKAGRFDRMDTRYTDHLEEWSASETGSRRDPFAVTHVDRPHRVGRGMATTGN